MCGICGVINYNKDSQRVEIVQKMNDKITHRGPDEAGYFSDVNCSLAMRRLAIIDLAHGAQPIYNKDKNIVVFFNGEIYNYKLLKNELQKLGYQFITDSDTEVLAHGYEEWGMALPEYLKGMFAFCLYNKKEQSYFFARDRFGEKPFYYHYENKVFSFSSEVSSLLENKNIPRILNESVLDSFLASSFIPEPNTLFKNIYSLLPGHKGLLTVNSFNVEPYFEINYKVNKNIKTIEDAMAFINPKLEAAVEKQKISDVPLGAFLSGGIDSSTIVAKLQKNTKERIKTFTVKFEEASYDESKIAREVADYLNTDHHEIVIPNQDFKPDIFWEIIDKVGMPFSDTSAIPTYFITKEIKNHVTVALSGDGGDELFAGYDIFDWWLKINKFRKLPSFTRTALSDTLNLAKKMPVLYNNSTLRKVHKAVDISLCESEEMPLAMNRMFEWQHITDLRIKPGKKRNNTYHPFTSLTNEYSSWSDLRKMMYYRCRFDLSLDMLIKVDRMSMANSLEVRAPFLDVDLFEASCQLPDEFLRKEGKGKYIIRKLMEKELPESVFNHPKSGFGLPLHRYHNQAFRDLADSLFVKENPMSKLINLDYIKELKKQVLSQRKDNAYLSLYRANHQLWLLMQLFGWVQYFDVEIE